MLRRLHRTLIHGVILCCAGMAITTATAQDLPEYRVKAAFVYNFLQFTEWPDASGGTLDLCILGSDPFGSDIDVLQGKPVGRRSIAVHRRGANESLGGCHAVFLSASVGEQMPRALERLRGRPVLTMADANGATRQGVALNMIIVRDKVAFEVNLASARAAGLNFSSKLLRLAVEVVQ